MIALYLNVFVLVVQAFQKVPPLKGLAPTQSEPPFVAAQSLVLLVFAALTIVAAIRYRPGQARLDRLEAVSELRDVSIMRPFSSLGACAVCWRR